MSGVGRQRLSDDDRFELLSDGRGYNISYDGGKKVFKRSLKKRKVKCPLPFKAKQAFYFFFILLPFSYKALAAPKFGKKCIYTLSYSYMRLTSLFCFDCAFGFHRVFDF